MTELKQYLEAAGFGERRAQTALYDHLIFTDNRGVVAQAGTGTGKSAAILSAAAHQARTHGHQALVVTPTLTLMNQYRDGDIPVARKAFEDLEFAEMRGRTHYYCEQAEAICKMMQIEYKGGCEGSDGGCTFTGYMGHEGCPEDCQEDHEVGWRCDYQAAKAASMRADVVVTNADMLIVNDRLLYGLGKNIFDMEGSLYVDEAHTLEQKLRDYASRSLWHKSLERFAFAEREAKALGRWVERQDRNIAISEARDFPAHLLDAIAYAQIPPARPRDGLAKQRETQEACMRIRQYLQDPHDNAVLHVGQGSLKMDWINVAKSSGELLTQRSFGLVSATVPRTMAATLGVTEAPFIDVGHPFDYANQAWLGFSRYGGSYRDAQVPENFERRVNEVVDLIKRSKGGALLLFSSFKDMEAVANRVIPQVRDVVGKTLVQEREMQAADRQAMASEFKADGNAVLFGSESFATGFDVPGNGLRLVVVWKLPYPAVDPVSNAIRNQSFQRYDDLMKVRAVQAIGRLIRTEADKGVVWIADSRGSRLLDKSDPLTSHLPTFARLP